MRQGLENKILLTGDDKILGVSLGADYCAEHEWGIKGLQHAFGFGDPEKFGLERRKITSIPPALIWVDGRVKTWGKERGNKNASCSGFWVKGYDSQPDDLPSGINLYGDATLWTGWSERDLGIFSIDAGETAKLKELYTRILELDAAIWLGGGGVFQNAGLGIAIASRLPTEITAMWDREHKKHKKLKEDVAATGIEYRLKAAGLKWYALSPKRQPDGSIAFWLNPEEQHKYEACWATIKDLEDWIAGTGKIMKPENRKRNTR